VILRQFALQKTLMLASAVLLLSACKSLPVDKAVIQSVEQRQVELRRFVEWQATGRLSVSSVDQGVAGGLNWQQRLQDYVLVLSSPLGQALVVEQTGASARLQRRGKSPVSGTSTESLMLQQLRIRVPLTQMTHWLRGLPGELGESDYDKFGRLKRLRYEDPDGIVWRAEIRRYRQFESMDLPALIVVQGGGFDIRLSITQWARLDTVPRKPGGNRLSIPGVNS